MKLHKNSFVSRRLVISAAVMTVCSTAYAIPIAPTASPFSSVPSHLINESTSTKQQTAKPNVTIFVDDSGSMGQEVTGTKRVRNGSSYTYEVDDYAEDGTFTTVTRTVDIPRYVVWARNESIYGKYATYNQWIGRNRYDNKWNQIGYYRMDNSERHLTRMEVTREALDKVVSKYKDKIHWNLISLWGSEQGIELYNFSYARDYGNTNGGAVLRALNNQGHASEWGYFTGANAPTALAVARTMESAPNGYQALKMLTANEMLGFIKNLKPTYGGGTPATSRYITAADYAMKAIRYQCQQNYIVMLSDGDANDGAGVVSTAVNSSEYRNLWTTNPNKTVYNYRTNPGTLRDLSSRLTGSYNGRVIDLKSNNERDFENLPFEDVQDVKTFTVGFGRDLSNEGRRYLQEGSTGKDAYFSATNSDELVKAFEKMFSEIENNSTTIPTETTSTSTPANASSSISGLAAILSLDTSKWSSVFKFYKFDRNGKVTKQNYPATFTNRKILMNNGKEIYWLYGGANNSSATVHTDFGFKDATEFTNAFLPWLARTSKTDAEIETAAKSVQSQNRTVEAYRERTKTANDPTRMMGDVLDSSAQTAGKNAKYLMVGANDGMFYIYRNDSVNPKEPAYNLVLNYLPGGMERESKEETLAKVLPTIAEKNYGQPFNPHIYGVNGGTFTVTTAEMKKIGGRKQQTILMSNMGQGGRGAFALKITGNDSTKANNSPVGLDADSSSWNISVPLWETQKGDDNMLGYTISKPSLYQLAANWTADGKKPDVKNDVRVAAFLANGFQSGNKSLQYDKYPTLYIYDALGEDVGSASQLSKSLNTAGNVLAKISTEKARADGPGALASPVVVDLDFDGIADVVYAGDYYGDLYRFDLRNTMPKKNADGTFTGGWKVTKIYDGDPSQPITAAPAVYNRGNNKVIVTFGTGSDIFVNDRKNMKVQSFFGIYDDLNQKEVVTAAKKDNLLQQTLVPANTVGQRTISPNIDTLDETRYRGWYVDLDAGSNKEENGVKKFRSSEKVTVQPNILLSSVFFTTRIYTAEESGLGSAKTATETCQVINTKLETGGTSWLMGLDVRTGGLLKTAKFRSDEKIANTDTLVGKDLGNLSGEATLLSYQNALKGTQSAINENGQVRTNGVLGDLDDPKTPPSNDCLESDDYNLYGAIANEDGLYNQGVTGNLCKHGGRLIRVNTREILE